MSNKFRELLKKIASGTHTHKDLTRYEMRVALELILTGIATPAQIGAFFIAHRIKRPTAEELAGMLDAYAKFSPIIPTLENKKYPLTILGIPYDGRTKTPPISPLTALMLSAMDVPVLMHGGTIMPTKYGLTLAEVWQFLDIDFTQLSLSDVSNLLNETNIGFLYLPQHFPLAHKLVKYREEIGKRPPLATIELIWQPYQGESHLIAGYVHPPTETMIREALKLRNVSKYTLIKGLEGSGDLKLDQTNIIVTYPENSPEESPYLKINPLHFNFSNHNPKLSNAQEYFKELTKVIKGKESTLTDISILNGGFYLWHCGVTKTIEEGFTQAKHLINQGALENQLDKIKSILIDLDDHT